jgi:death-on-curing family protein
MNIQYFGMKACMAFGFPWIYDELTSVEPVPQYEIDIDGLANLQKTLDFVKNDTYYPDFHEKCSYLLCNIAGSQYFTNGNKRLGVTILLMFLQKNDAYISEDYEELKSLLKKYFPEHRWEENKNLPGDAHSRFLYNLAIVIGDRHIWGTNDFNKMRSKVTEIFRYMYLLVERDTIFDSEALNGN